MAVDRLWCVVRGRRHGHAGVSPRIARGALVARSLWPLVVCRGAGGFEHLCERLGVGRDRTLVLVGDSSAWHCGRSRGDGHHVVGVRRAVRVGV